MYLSLHRSRDFLSGGDRGPHARRYEPVSGRRCPVPALVLGRHDDGVCSDPIGVTAVCLAPIR